MTEVSELHDEKRLVEGARGGDQRAIEAILRTQQPRIYAVCRRITGSDADALDATQEAMIAVARGLANFDGRARLSTWCYRIATNASLDELRRRKRRPIVGLPSHDGEEVEVADPTAPDPATKVTDQDTVDTALSQLSPEFRAAVVLRDICQVDYAEIAEILEIPPGTVRSRIARARAQLADLLAGNQTDPDERQTHAP